MAKPERLCVRCDQPVILNYDSYEAFERMHWLCFHMVFEHTGDADLPCHDPSCPWWHIEVFRAKLKELGNDPQEVLLQAMKGRWPNHLRS